jgi:hydroxyethylthiazole kinase-like uncharacterized protein yjeF
MPLPAIGQKSEKHERGATLVCGGAPGTPGGVLLAGVAALRVGAGKLQLGVHHTAAVELAVAVPEALVVGLGDIEQLVQKADAVLVGPGTAEPGEIAEVFAVVVKRLDDEATLVVDAGALAALANEPSLIADVRGQTILMPNPAEMAVLLDRPVKEIKSDPHDALAAAVERFGTTVTLRMAETLTGAPGRPSYLDQAGGAGLGTSGSGDVLAGAIAGLAARGADPLTATVWATHLHAIAGDRCSARVGPVGFLARELLDELPPALVSLS